MRGFNLIIRENSYFLSKFWTSSLTGQIKTEFKVKNCWSGPFTKSLSVYVYVCLFALLACLFVCLSSEGGKWQMQTLGERATWALYFLERWKEGRWKLGYICFDKKPFHKILIIACTILDRKFWFGSNRNSVWLVKQSKLLTSQWLVRFVFAFVWLSLKLHFHMRLRLKIAPAGRHVMLGRQVAGRTDDPCQAAGAIFSLNLTYKGSMTLYMRPD